MAKNLDITLLLSFSRAHAYEPEVVCQQHDLTCVLSVRTFCAQFANTWLVCEPPV